MLGLEVLFTDFFNGSSKSRISAPALDYPALDTFDPLHSRTIVSLQHCTILFPAVFSSGGITTISGSDTTIPDDSSTLVDIPS